MTALKSESGELPRVLVCIDGSPASQHAVSAACTWLAGKKLEVTLLRVIPRHLVIGAGGPVPAEVYDLHSMQDEVQAMLDGVADTLEGRAIGPVLQTEIALGDPAEVILAIAAQDGTDLIIMGSRELRPVRRMMLGSVSHRVLAHASCPVLLAHPEQHTGSAEPRGIPRGMRLLRGRR